MQDCYFSNIASIIVCISDPYLENTVRVEGEVKEVSMKQQTKSIKIKVINFETLNGSWKNISLELSVLQKMSH